MSNKAKNMMLSRRGALGAFATVTGGLILRSLATGIPARVLLDPLSAHAAEPGAGKMLILSCSSSGDPLNANVPGTYGKSDLFHPPGAEFAATSMKLGSQTATGAKVWADLPQNILDRTCFFHHATFTPVHGELRRVQRMMNATEKNDMLVSLLARELAPRLGTVQSDPVSLGANGGELLSSGGRVLANVGPTSVQKALGGVDGPLKDLTKLRDQSIDRVYALYKERGTPSQRTMLEAWARSRDEVRGIGGALISRLDAINGNNQENQVRTAAVLAAMNITPVITLKLDFGGDNHTDAGLAREASRHQTAIAQLALLMDELDTMRAENLLKHDVLVGCLNVFGRTLKKKGTAGRDHNKSHHVTVLMGNGVRGGVVGGVQLDKSGKEYEAQAIDSGSGKGGSSGDIAYEDTLNSMGKTLGAAVGVDSDRLNQMIPGGKIVQSVVG